jgi:hypothetical protein
MYNRQLHQDEIKKINAQIDDFSNKTGMSKEESLKLLTIAAKYYNDKDTQMNTPALNEEQIEAGYISTTKYTKAQIDEAYNYLLNNSQGQTFIDTYKEDMTSQQLFTSTDEQYKNSNWKPDNTKGLEDSSLTFVPTVKVGQTLTTTTKEVSPVVIKKTGQVYDDVTLGITNKMLNITPKTEQIIDITSDVVNSYLPGVPSNNFVGLGTSVFGTFYGYEKMGNDLGDIFKELKNEINKFKFENTNEK